MTWDDILTRLEASRLHPMEETYLAILRQPITLSSGSVEDSLPRQPKAHEH